MIETWLMEIGRLTGAVFWAPVLVWTVLAVPVLVALHLGRGVHPVYGYRLGQALLWSLPAALLLRPWAGIASPAAGLLEALYAPAGPSALPVAPAATSASDVAVGASLELVPAALGLAFVLVVVGAAARAGLLAWRLGVLRQLDRALLPLEDPELLARAERLRHELRVRRPVLFRMGPAGSVPMTYGWRRPVVAIPLDLAATPGAFALAMGHELIHVRRADYLWGILEQALVAAFSFHPLVWTLEKSVARLREASCDSEVMTHTGDARSYGELLLNVSSRSAPPPVVAAGMSTPPSKLKQRLETMKRFIDHPGSRTRAVKSVGVALALGLVVTLSAACGSQPPEVADTGDPADVAAALTSAYGVLADETREEALRRLGVQMDYLNERIEEMQDSIRTLELQGRDAPPHIWERARLLNSMYLQRLETYETLMLEAETERRLADL